MARATQASARDLRTPRQRAFDRLYAETHVDFKGMLQDGTRTVMSWAKFGGGLATADTISDGELAERAGLVLA